MLEITNIPLCTSALAQFEDSSALREYLQRIRCDGLEVVWGGEECDVASVPRDAVIGYHLTFFNDWLDFFRGDKEALRRKFGDKDTVRRVYGGMEPSELPRRYSEDLERASAWGAKYVVFHVSDVSIEEGYTFQWLHSDTEVIDTAAEIINHIFAGKNYEFELLLENLPWPGFRFTDPALTERLLNKIEYPHKGIMLDIGHLMCTERGLRNEREGVRFVQEVLDRHGTLCEFIKGIHLHKSLSGDYVRTHTGFLPKLPRAYFDRYSVSYRHVLQIDTHKPWTDPGIVSVISRLKPEYLVHELAAADEADKARVVALQVNTLKKGDWK